MSDRVFRRTILTEFDSIIVYSFVARLGERFILSLVVISVALVSMIAFWRSVQRVEFSLSQDKLGTSASIALATPLLVLLVVVGFAYISYSHPVSVTLPERSNKGTAAEPPLVTSLIGVAPASTSNLTREQDLQRLRGYLKTLVDLEAALRKSALEDEASFLLPDIEVLRVGLMQSHWDSDLGDWATFRAWLADPGAPPPTDLTLAADLYHHGR